MSGITDDTRRTNTSIGVIMFTLALADPTPPLDVILRPCRDRGSCFELEISQKLKYILETQEIWLCIATQKVRMIPFIIRQRKLRSIKKGINLWYTFET